MSTYEGLRFNSESVRVLELIPYQVHASLLACWHVISFVSFRSLGRRPPKCGRHAQLWQPEVNGRHPHADGAWTIDTYILRRSIFKTEGEC